MGACVNLLVYMFLGSSAFYVALVYNTVAAGMLCVVVRLLQRP